MKLVLAVLKSVLRLVELTLWSALTLAIFIAALSNFWLTTAILIITWVLYQLFKKKKFTRLCNFRSKASASSSARMYGLPDDIAAAWEMGDYDTVRRQLQKIAYTMVEPDVDPKEKQAFTRLMTAFASEDPLYASIMHTAKTIIQQEPGILQSQLTKKMPEYRVEHIRYALYFGHEIGDIFRVKKGRSYQLHLPGETLEAE